MNRLDLDHPVIRRSDGTSARIEDDAIVIRNRHGESILSCGERGVRLIAVEGDLTLAAPKGRVIVEAGTDLDVSAARRMTLRAEEASLETERASLIAERLVSCCASVAHRVGRWELHAERIAERATDLYLDIGGLFQSRAGRLRQIVSGASQLISKRASITCEEDVSIDGRRVLLG